MGSMPLPTYGFRWLSSHEIERLDVMSIPDDADKGYIFVVDLHIPAVRLYCIYTVYTVTILPFL